MTKLKNTKKGMAKKALSVSLVAAMLATSNVPVWAAEDLFSDGSTIEAPVVEETPAAQTEVFSDNAPATVEESSSANNATVLSEDNMTAATDFSKVTFSSDLNGNITIGGRVIKNDDKDLQEYNYQLIQGDTLIAEGLVTDGKLNVQAKAPTSGNVTLRLFRNDGVYNIDWELDRSVRILNETIFNWDFNGQAVEGGVAFDAGTLSVKALLPTALTTGEKATITLTGQTGKASTDSLNGSGDTLNASYTLSKEDIGKTITATVTVTDASGTSANVTSKINVTDSYVTLTGKPNIKVKNGEAEIYPGVVLTADTADVSAPSDPNFNDYSYQWQKYNSATQKWENIADGTGIDYEVKVSDYKAELRVAVFGGEYYNADKSVFSDSVIVEEDKLNEDILKATVLLQDSNHNNIPDKYFNPLDTEANKLVKEDGSSLINITYGDRKDLVAGTDYTLKYEGIDQIGNVDVTVTILPTEKTEFASGTKVFKDLYELRAPKANTDYDIISENTTSEYNGKAVTPKVTIATNNEQTIVDPSEYKVYSVGPDAGTYDINVYVNGRGMAESKGQTHTISPKQINNHEEDFNLVIPDAVWDASEGAVESNTVKDAKIQLFDNAISATDDLMEKGGYTIEALNWGEGGVKKAIRITFTAGNYRGTLVVDGDMNSRSIAQFQAQFTTKIRNEAGARIYNGRLQDVLGEILTASHGSITFTDGTKLYEGRDFEYKIVKGGTDAGDVSIYIEGKGNYDGSMTLSNVYTIGKANFQDDVIGSGDFTISYDPSLGDAGADISAYIDLAKNKYSASMKDGGYKLTLDKDFWLDRVSSSDNAKVIWYQPTVAENKVEGHGENPNFVTTDASANRGIVRATLVAKNLNDSDIQITVESAEYNGGDLVVPTVKVAYIKDGKEYVINPAYYDVQIVRSAYDEGDVGKVNIVAKTVDSQKYPQLYTGNQMIDYTVGKTNLALGSIVATNGLPTLPSVAYDADQAASEDGIVLAADKYVVKDASGNIVDPKYYTVTFTNNKAVGTATITVTGKAPYEGSISADFTITKNNLPSGNVVLMSDELSKAYTGEGIELVKGTDYNITGELAKLTEGTDYMIAYDNNINVTDDKNKASFKVVGINNYAGEIVKSFDITPAKISAEDVTLGDTTYAGGQTIKPSVTITVPGGNTTLAEGTDYTVDYVPAATNVGDTGKVVITYSTSNKNINGADSVKSVEYGVTAKDLKDVIIQPIADQEATGEQIKPELTVMNGSVELVEGKDYTVTYGKNTEIGLGTVTIQPVDGNKNYTGSQEAQFKIIEAKPEVGQAVINEVRVSGNKVTPVLASEVEGAVGYDYVLATEEDYTNGRVQISKNILDTNTNFFYVEEGTYYVYCHAWKRDENGLKKFGDWSNIMKVEVTATTPERPQIVSAKLNGRNLTVTWNKAAGATTGYDIVMGKEAKKVNGELRPVNYGKAVKKVGPNTFSVTFRSIPKGTYYVGLHAHNRTSENGAKVFSPWSGVRKIVVK